MSLNFSFDHLRGKVKMQQPGRPDPESPFRILVMGDFSGRSNRSNLQPLTDRAARKADIDTFESLMRDWKTSLAIGAGTDHAIGIGFQELESFHPDELLQRVEPFGALRNLRARLKNPTTSASAAAEVRAWSCGQSTTQIEAKPTESPGTPESDFEALLAGSTGGAPSRAESSINALIRNLISEHIVPAADPDLDQLVGLVDAAIGGLMKKILRDPAFRNIESNWRALHELVTGLELDEELELFAADVSRDEIEADIRDNGAQGLTQLLTRAKTTAGGKPWSVVCVLERFSDSASDAMAVGALSLCAHGAGAVVLADAGDQLAQVDALWKNPKPEQWTRTPDAQARDQWILVRSLPESGAVGLVLPRTLMRLPYGPRTEPVDAFEFQEIEEMNDHEALPWGHSAHLCALLLGRSFTQRGWSLDAQAGGEIEGLPVYVARHGPDQEAHPCTETWLTDSAANALLDRGLIPVVSIQHRDAVRIPRLTSISGKPLLASWT